MRTWIDGGAASGGSASWVLESGRLVRSADSHGGHYPLRHSGTGYDGLSLRL